jgi:hypothetical protein
MPEYKVVVTERERLVWRWKIFVPGEAYDAGALSLLADRMGDVALRLDGDEKDLSSPS